MCVACLILLAGVAAAVNGTDILSQAVQTADEKMALEQNALYLLLRLAGIVWIAIEWVAAILLWRGYRLLKDAVRRKGLTP